MSALALATVTEQTMSSREIAELVGSRHDKVKQSIERLAGRGVIAAPPLGEYLDSLGRPASEYRVGKRDSYVIVAQLSPEFTGRLVDRWQQLEEQVRQPAIDLSDPKVLRQLLTANVDKVIALEAKVEIMREDVEAHVRLTKADGSLTRTEAAKNLGVRPSDLFRWLDQHGWTYRRPGSATRLGYADKCNAGLLEHKSTPVQRPDGTDKISEQVRITPKGLSRLAKLIKPAPAAAPGQQPLPY